MLSYKQFHQLPMFAPAHVLMDMESSDSEEYGGHDHMWDVKMREAAAPGSSVSAHYPDRFPGEPSLVESVKAHGVQSPAVVMHHGRHDDYWGGLDPMLVNGHHRVAAAAARSHTAEVPIQHVHVEEAPTLLDGRPYWKDYPGASRDH